MILDNKKLTIRDKYQVLKYYKKKNVFTWFKIIQSVNFKII